MPFVEPSSSYAPGPGSYGGAKSSFRTQLQKRLTDDPIAFSSTDMRPCLKPEVVTVSAQVRGLRSAPPLGPNPGPGDYDLENQSIVNAIKKKTFGRHGIFGTCTTRFDPHCLPPEVAKLLQYHGDVERDITDTPGPGSYEMGSTRSCHDQASQGRSKIKPQPIYTFRSNVERFGTQEYDVRAPDVLQVGARQKPSVGSRTASIAFHKHNVHCSGEYVLPSSFDQSHKAARACPFSSLTSKTRRFDEGRLFNGDLIAETPGPGTARRHDSCFPGLVCTIIETIRM